MVKKKRQSEPGEQGDDSTESCDENVKTTCPHVPKAVDLTQLKKVLKTKGFVKECAECAKSPEPSEVDRDYEVDLSLWMCLRCGTQLCGRARSKHALAHYKTPRSDCHALTANTSSWELYCYSCNNEVRAASTKKLLECVEYLKKQANLSSPTQNLQFNDIALEISPIITKHQPLTLKLKDKEAPATVAVQRVRGLSNLGNTCFFNSVMQCLVQTPYLLPVLKQMAEPGEKFYLPGGTLKVEGAKEETAREIELPPISGELSEWGLLTRTLAETLEELQTPGKCDVFSPRKLLQALTTKLPQFGGGDQHDSHELLRHLLEAVRSEDLRRYQSVILGNVGLSTKVDPAKVEGDTKLKVKYYGQQASDTMLRPEQVFRGFLVSTLECQECFHTSDRHEYFLDLSLPVTADRPQPPAMRRKTPTQDDNILTLGNQDENKPSKHQLKKERIAARKGRKNRSNTASNSPKSKDNSPAGDGTETPKEENNKSSSEQSDADIEDNVEENPKCESTAAPPPPPLPPALPDTAANFAAFMESGYNSEKVISSDSVQTSPSEVEHKEKCDNSPENKNKDNLELTDLTGPQSTSNVIALKYKPLTPLDNSYNQGCTSRDSGVASPDTTKGDGENDVQPNKELGSPISLSSEINLDLSSPQLVKISPVKNEFERPVSRISFSAVKSARDLGDYYGPKNSVENLVSACDKESPETDLASGLGAIKLNDDSKVENQKPLALTYGSSSFRDNSNFYNATDSYKLNDADSEYALKKDRFATVSPRYQSDDGECSIQSCLNQFTALELMTGNNKVGCEACTKRLNGENGKTVYTNATKRFLVSNPPAVLILHLKRFQIGARYMFRKMTKQVNFPIVLDLAPFCSARKIRTLPNMSKGQTKVLYSLYGVVEHSGGMHGGHYVAYVKVRSPIHAEEKRLSFLPTGGNVKKDEVEEDKRTNGNAHYDSESSLSGYESGEGVACGGLSSADNVQPTPGKWFYVSDSRVQEISEEKVLQAQAYLLFYERIL